MLVLSRRKQQKVVFPNLGIAIKVVEIRRSNVRLGVVAPKEIRVVRDELAFQPCDSVDEGKIPGRPSSPARFDRIPGTNDRRLVKVMVGQLDAANLAIHLAQNQLRQGRTEYAEESLQHAINCLNEIEMSAGLISFEELETIREPSTPYQVGSLPKALVIGGSSDERQVAIQFLRGAGIQVDQRKTCNSLQLLRTIQSNSAGPNLVLLLEPRGVLHNIQPPLLLKLGTLEGLTRRANVNMNGQLATLWMLNGTTIPSPFQLVD